MIELNNLCYKNNKFVWKADVSVTILQVFFHSWPDCIANGITRKMRQDEGTQFSTLSTLSLWQGKNIEPKKWGKTSRWCNRYIWKKFFFFITKSNQTLTRAGADFLYTCWSKKNRLGIAEHWIVLRKISLEMYSAC